MKALNWALSVPEIFFDPPEWNFGAFFYISQDLLGTRGSTGR